MRTLTCLALLAFAAPAFADEQASFKVYFQSEEPYLSPAAREVLKVVAERATGCPLKSVDIAGHTDTAERDPDSLSLTRVLHVQNELTKRGVPQKSIHLEMRGAQELAVKTETNVREPENRRAEIIITCGDPAPWPAPAATPPAARPKLKPLAELLHPAPVPGEPPHKFSVHFEAEGGFSDPGRNQLDAHVGYAKKCNFERMDVVGHADPNEKNANLVAYSRALQVRSAYVKAGLPETKIIAIGAAASKPVMTTGDAVAAALNRRAEVTITCAQTF